MTERTVICPNCSDYERAFSQLRASEAFFEPHEGRLRVPVQAAVT